MNDMLPPEATQTTEAEAEEEWLFDELLKRNLVPYGWRHNDERLHKLVTFVMEQTAAARQQAVNDALAAVSLTLPTGTER